MSEGALGSGLTLPLFDVIARNRKVQKPEVGPKGGSEEHTGEGRPPGPTAKAPEHPQKPQASRSTRARAEGGVEQDSPKTQATCRLLPASER